MRKLIDFWSVPHFLFGVVAALVAVVFEYPFTYAFYVTLTIALLWEVFEAKYRLGEVSINVLSDIALPLVAFPITYVLASHEAITFEHRVTLLVITGIIYIYSNVVAWRARLEDRDPDFLS